MYRRSIREFAARNDPNSPEFDEFKVSEHQFSQHILKTVWSAFREEAVTLFKTSQKSARISCLDYARTHLFRLTSTRPGRKHFPRFKDFLQTARAGQWLDIFQSTVVPYLKVEISEANNPAQGRLFLYVSAPVLTTWRGAGRAGRISSLLPFISQAATRRRSAAPGRCCSPPT